MGTHIFAVARDVTVRRAAEAQLRNAFDTAECANRAKSEFLAMMSHELRTPLNAIIGFAQMTSSETFGALGHDKYREYATAIETSGQLLLDIINSVLDLSKNEAGALELSDETVAVESTVREVARMLEPQVTSADLHLELDIQDGDTNLHGDARLIKQMITNLVANAVKFTPADGTVSISVRTIDTADVEIVVADTGIGIKPEDLEKALRPFGQIDNLYSRKHLGTGLGLPLARMVAEKHGGSLTLQSVPGEGTRVRVFLPSKIPQ